MVARNLLTVVVPTINEAANIERCLANINRLNVPVVVLDTFSSDGTPEIAKQYGAHVIQGQWKSFSEKINYAGECGAIETPWIMRVDADEVVDDQLAKALIQVLSQADKEVAAYAVDRRFVFLGRWLRFGGMSPSWQIRVWRKGRAVMEVRELDEHMQVEGIIGKLSGAIYDNDLKGMHTWLDKHNRYADKEVAQVQRGADGTLPHEAAAKRKRILKERIYYKMPLFVRVFAFWFVRYVLQLGFLDGKEGFVFHILHSFGYRFIVDVKLYEQEKVQQGRLPEIYRGVR